MQRDFVCLLDLLSCRLQLRVCHDHACNVFVGASRRRSARASCRIGQGTCWVWLRASPVGHSTARLGRANSIYMMRCLLQCLASRRAGIPSSKRAPRGRMRGPVGGPMGGRGVKYTVNICRMCGQFHVYSKHTLAVYMVNIWSIDRILPGLWRGICGLTPSVLTELLHS